MKRPIKSLLIFMLLILVIAGMHFHSIIEASDHRYFVDEPDAYMHLVIASDLLEHHNWYQHDTERLNAPFGADTHAWTQVISAILVSGAWLIGFVKPQTTALYIWGFVLPILMNAFAACMMLWNVKPIKPTPYQQLFIVAAFLLNPFTNSYFIPLRVDYDFLLLTLGIVYLGCFLRLLLVHEIRWVVFSALIAGIGIWTSISFVLLVLISLAFTLFRGREQLSATIKFVGVLCVVLSLILPLEHRSFFSIAYDIVSIAYLVFFLLILLNLLFYKRISCHLTQYKKLLLIIFLMLLNALIMNFIFPGFYLGPYNHVDPYLLQHFFPVVSEFYSPFCIDNALTLALLFYFIVGVGYCFYLYLDNHSAFFSKDKMQNEAIGFLLWMAICLMALTVYMYRWNEFAVPVTILLISFVFKKITRKLVNICLVIMMSAIPALILLLSQNAISSDLEKCQQQFHDMIHDGFWNKKQFSHDRIMFAETNYGPLILFATHFSVVATNDHHNPLGIKDSFNFFKENENAAKNMMTRRGVDLVLLCQAKTPTGFDLNSAQWLDRISLPDIYSYWRLYRVKHGLTGK